MKAKIEIQMDDAELGESQVERIAKLIRIIRVELCDSGFGWSDSVVQDAKGKKIGTITIIQD